MSSPRSPGLSTFLLALALLLGGCQVSGPEFGSPSSVHNQDLAARQRLSDVASYSAASEQPSASTVAAASSNGAASAARPREAVYLGAGTQDGEGEGQTVSSFEPGEYT